MPKHGGGSFMTSAPQPNAAPTDESSKVWDSYNTLLLSPDIERVRKLLVRYDLFRLTLEIPGDIVECGVLKGSGFMYWLKLLNIRAHGSAKRVVGFDLFSEFLYDADEASEDAIAHFVSESGYRGISTTDLAATAVAAGFSPQQFELIPGDIRESAAEYVAANPGFRISLLHMDLDVDVPTRAALEALWPRLVTGGIVVFDEYALPRWSESVGVDTFFADKHVQLRTTPWARSPTAYAVKLGDHVR